MNTFTVVFFCIQACLVQNVFGQCTSRAAVADASGLLGPAALSPYGLNSPIAYGVGRAIRKPCPMGYPDTGRYAACPLGYGPGSSAYLYDGIPDIAYPGAAGWAGPYGAAGPYGNAAAPYGGSGEGNVAVAGELPVAGTTAVAGQVPIMGAVQFSGPVAAAGTVSIVGQCACGCNAPYMI